MFVSEWFVIPAAICFSSGLFLFYFSQYLPVQVAELIWKNHWANSARNAALTVFSRHGGFDLLIAKLAGNQWNTAKAAVFSKSTSAPIAGCRWMRKRGVTIMPEHHSPKRNAKKSFRLHLPSSPDLAVGSETSYTPEVIEKLKIEFRPIANRYRIKLRIYYVLLCIMFSCPIIGCLLGMWPVFVTFFVMAPCVIVYGWSLILFSGLKCPGCSQRLDLDRGEYCPECGHLAELETQFWIRRICSACKMPWIQ